MPKNPNKPDLCVWRVLRLLRRGIALLLAVGLMAATATVNSVAADAPSAPNGERLTPKAFRAAVQKVLPSLVTIETFGGVNSGSGKRRGQMTGISKPGDGPTTGLIVSPDGYIITSTYNFIKKPPIITVILHDGTQHVAELLGRDETRKICLLKIEGAKDLPVPTFVPRSELKVGQWAISVGVGFGDDDPAISAGIISATHRISDKAVQTDSNTSPANYGGPLVDIEGRVIGVCVPLSPDSQSTAAGTEWYDSGIGFAVPLQGAEELLAQLKAGKTIQPGRLGISPRPVSPAGGVAIAQVARDSAAAKAGLQPNDELVSVGGEKVIDLMQLKPLIGRYVAGDKVAVVVKRGDKELTIDVTLEAGVEQPTPGPMPMPVPEKPTPEKPADKPAPDKPVPEKPAAEKPAPAEPKPEKP